MWVCVFKHFGSILTDLCTQVLERKISFEFANGLNCLDRDCTKRLKRFKNNFAYKFLGVKFRSKLLVGNIVGTVSKWWTFKILVN